MANKIIIDLWHWGDNAYSKMQFVLGNPADVNNYCGDDWDKDTYAKSQGVKGKFIKGYSTIDFNYSAIVKEPIDDKHHCKNDFKNRLLPCLAVVPPQYVQDYKLCGFSDLVKEARKPNSPIILIYLGDRRGDVFKRLRTSGSIVAFKPAKRRRRKQDEDDDYYDR